MSRAVRLAGLAALAPALGACMTAADAGPVATAPAQAGNSCHAEPAQRYLGTLASEQAASDLLRAAGASEIRWVPPGTMVTMEYKYGRLTVGYDGQMKITSIACS